MKRRHALIWFLLLLSVPARAQLPHDHAPRDFDDATAATLARHGIPDFAGATDIFSVKSGVWCDETVWSGGVVPGPDDVVCIRHSVMVDAACDAKALSIGVAGTLTTSGKLTVKDLIVYAPGVLDMQPGTDVVIRDLPFAVDDPKQWGGGIIVLGTWTAKGYPKTPYVRCLRAIKAGESVLQLEQAPTGWALGDWLVIPQTSQIVNGKTRTRFETELQQVLQVNGNVVDLVYPVKYAHDGAPENRWGVELFPHVANLTRSITIRSENPNGTRGHTACVGHDVNADLDGIAFVNLGRTLAGLPTTDGPVVAVPNQRGRYPWHMHHLHDAGTFAIRNCVSDGNRKWGGSIHNTSGGLCEQNIAYDSDGAGIVTEDGNELDNILRANLVIKVNRSGGGQNNDGAGGDGIWSHAGGNVYQGNICYDCGGIGANFDGYTRRPEPPSTKLVQRPPAEVEGLEVWSSRQAIWLTWSQTFGSDIQKLWARTHVNGLVAINCWGSVVETFHEGKVTFSDALILSDPAVSSLNIGGTSVDTRCVVAFDFSHGGYENYDMVVERARVSGVNIALTATQSSGLALTTIRDSELSAWVAYYFERGADPAKLLRINNTFLPTTVKRIGKVMPVSQTEVVIQP